MIYDDGKTIYEGPWEEGLWSGENAYLQTNEGTYRGAMERSKFHGTGRFEYGTEAGHDEGFLLFYEGDYCNGQKTKGRIHFRDGSSYWGTLDKYEKPHGRGKHVTKQGNIYDGEFNHNVREGHGRMTWSDGSYYLGEWCEDQYNGEGKLVAADGRIVHQGLFVNGAPSGGPQEYKPVHAQQRPESPYLQSLEAGKKPLFCRLSIFVENIFSTRRLIPKKTDT